MPLPQKVIDSLGPITAATRKKLDEVWDVAVKNGHTPSYAWGWGPNPEHNSKRALDFMIYPTDGSHGLNSSAGDFIRNYLWANRARLGVRHIIWKQHITSTVVQPGVVRGMANRGSVTANHYDHVHVLFLDDRYSAPSAGAPSTKPKPKPVPATGSKVRQLGLQTPQMHGADVTRLQREMNRVFPAYSRLKVDGYFGPATNKVVREFQRRAGVKVDGWVGPNTRKALARNGVRL